MLWMWSWIVHRATNVCSFEFLIMTCQFTEKPLSTLAWLGLERIKSSLSRSHNLDSELTEPICFCRNISSLSTLKLNSSKADFSALIARSRNSEYYKTKESQARMFNLLHFTNLLSTTLNFAQQPSLSVTIKLGSRHVIFLAKEQAIGVFSNSLPTIVVKKDWNSLLNWLIWK